MLQTLKVVGATLRVGPGAVMRLSKKQAEARTGRLEKIGDDLFRARDGLEFKSGEVLGIALDDVPKHLHAFMETEGGGPPVQASRAPVKAKAKA